MTDEDAIRLKANGIRKTLADLRDKLRSGDEGQLVVWIIPAGLACAHRPLRYHPKFGGSGCSLPSEAATDVKRWVERILETGIKSVICLMHPKEIRHYSALNLNADDILGFYRTCGLIVHHIPWDDPAHRPPDERQSFMDELMRVREEALGAFERLPKPVLLHCSAGMDRSAPVAAYIHHHRSEM